MEYNVHEVKWTEEKVAKFWDYCAGIDGLEYFSQEVGNEVIDIVVGQVPVTGEILDYGCGSGYLIRYLLDRKAGTVSGCDFSGASVEAVAKKFQAYSNFGEATLISRIPTGMPSGKYDMVFCLETVEHLLDSFLDPTLKELNRLLKVGGYVVVTTRNEENLEKLKVICPDCGAVFHRVQHVRSFSPVSIQSLFKNYSFESVYCETHTLGGSSRKWVRIAKKAARVLLRYPQRVKPNLVYVGRKLR